MSNSLLNRTFLEGCQAKELRLQKCRNCQHVQFYPRIACSQCGSDSLEWTAAGGSGTVNSYTVIRQAISQEYKALLPYVAAIVELDEGPTMMTVIVDADELEVTVGARVSLAFLPWGGEQLRPIFRLTNPEV